jgi:hypothetical protein
MLGASHTTDEPVPPERAGVDSEVSDSTRQGGGALGAAVLAASARPATLADAALASLMNGVNSSLLIGAAVAPSPLAPLWPCSPESVNTLDHPRHDPTNVAATTATVAVATLEDT